MCSATASVPLESCGEGQKEDGGGQVSEDDEEQRADAGGEGAVQEHHVDSVRDLYQQVAGDDEDFLQGASCRGPQHLCSGAQDLLELKKARTNPRVFQLPN